MGLAWVKGLQDPRRGTPACPGIAPDARRCLNSVPLGGSGVQTGDGPGETHLTLNSSYSSRVLSMQNGLVFWSIPEGEEPDLVMGRGSGFWE